VGNVDNVHNVVYQEVKKFNTNQKNML